MLIYPSPPSSTGYRRGARPHQGAVGPALDPARYRRRHPLLAYDVYYFALDLMPYILLQGIGFMSLIIGTFYCFSQEIADTNKRCVLYAAEMQKSKEARDALFLRIRRTPASPRRRASG
jgi:hypothetical protein